MRFVRFGISVTASSEWKDVTDELDSEQGQAIPFTLNKGGCDGALQFSTARYKSGNLPLPTQHVLLEMVVDHGKRGCQLGAPTAQCTWLHADLIIAEAQFDSGTDHVVLWYVSDGLNFALASFVSPTSEFGRLIDEIRTILNTLSFE